MRLLRLRNADDPRRRLLIQALALGLFSLGSPAGRALAADIFGRRPSKLPAGQSIYRLEGTATVNGKPATLATRIGATDTVETGKGSEIVFAVGESAFILRESSRIALESKQKDSALITGLRVLTGKLLSVFPKGRPLQVGTLTSTIGIRGTGFYTETDPEQTYFCTCYGVTDIAATKDPQSTTTVAAVQHDRPLYILAKAPRGEAIRPAPFINHTDQELQVIEALVGRVPPFVFPKEDYRAPRRDY
ncbi:MAG TPA: iron dicitrate transport regulator FecR [Burkholderiales bacterium]|nr:iron dicitrate transport regulator FecR [Burkholderiales bacterium]